MPAPATVLSSVFATGGRVSRYGDFTMIHMHNCSFITTAMEFLQMQNWARGRMSSGNAIKDRSLFADRFETVLGRNGSGIASRGSRVTLLRLVKAMTANGMLMSEWNVPRDLDQGVEIKKKVPAAAQAVRAAGTFASANETVPAGGLVPVVGIVPVGIVPEPAK